MVLEIATVTKDTQHLLPLLQEAYEKIYKPAFQNPDSRESLEKFMLAINGGIPKVGIVVNILGDHLHDPEKRVLKGISIAYYYEPQNVGLLAYNAIAPEHREGGLGKLMVESRIEALKELAKKQGKELEGVFVDVNDPEKVAVADDSMDPAQRIALFQKWGARIVPIDYVQPPLEADGYYCDVMKLMNYPLDGKFATRAKVVDFLSGLYRESRSDTDPEKDHFFRQMKEQILKADLSHMQPPESNAQPGYKVNVPPYKFVA